MRRVVKCIQYFPSYTKLLQGDFQQFTASSKAMRLNRNQKGDLARARRQNLFWRQQFPEIHVRALAMVGPGRMHSFSNLLKKAFCFSLQPLFIISRTSISFWKPSFSNSAGLVQLLRISPISSCAAMSFFRRPRSDSSAMATSNGTADVLSCSFLIFSNAGLVWQLSVSWRQLAPGYLKLWESTWALSHGSSWLPWEVCKASKMRYMCLDLKCGYEWPIEKLELSLGYRRCPRCRSYDTAQFPFGA